MKKFVGFAVAFALCGVMAGCGSTNNPTDTDPTDDIIIPDNDTNGDTDVVVNPDTIRDDNNDPDVVGVDTKTDDVVCTPNCGTQECGVDPECGTSCGTCGANEECVANMCEPVTECTGDDAGSCSAFYDCLGGCGNLQTTEGEACATECQGQMSAQGQADYQVIQQCLYTTCGGISDEDLWNDCLNENCGPAIIGCFWGCTYLTCAEMNGCTAGCPDDDPATTDDEFSACYWDCHYDSTKEAQLDQGEIRDCIIAKCPICLTWETQEEGEQCDACYSDTYYGDCWDTAVATSCMVFGTQYDTCYEFTVCFQACPSSPAADRQACMNACTEGSTADAFHDRIMAEDCSGDLCPECMLENPTTEQQATCESCWGDSVTGECADAWSTCMPPPGTDPCNTVFQCINSCTGNGCQQTCYNEGTEHAQDLFGAIQDCLGTECDQYTDETEWSNCANTAINQGGACATQMAACQADA